MAMLCSMQAAIMTCTTFMDGRRCEEHFKIIVNHFLPSSPSQPWRAFVQQLEVEASFFRGGVIEA